MSQDLTYADCLDHIAGELQRASVSTTELLTSVIKHTCARVPILAIAGKTARLRRLIEADAQVDATLALIELELPQWRLRRLSLDDDQWFCSLSRRSNLPIELDDTADGQHEDPVLAILIAYVEALRMTRAAGKSTASMTSSRPIGGQLVCCDNFY